MTASLANGDLLNAETFANFVERLKHDCHGPRFIEHGTGQVIFHVEEKSVVTGIDRELTENAAILKDDQIWLDLDSFLRDACKEDMDRFEALSKHFHKSSFNDQDKDEKLDIIEQIEGYSVSGFHQLWKTINVHFTHDAAQSYIDKNSSKHKMELRIAEENQYRCDEFNAIKNAILQGKLVYEGGGYE